MIASLVNSPIGIQQLVVASILVRGNPPAAYRTISNDGQRTIRERCNKMLDEAQRRNIATEVFERLSFLRMCFVRCMKFSGTTRYDDV